MPLSQSRGRHANGKHSGEGWLGKQVKQLGHYILVTSEKLVSYFLR